MIKLKNDYEKACNNYVKSFCEKQDMEFYGWVDNKVGEIALCNDFYFNLFDIVWDINSNQPKYRIIDWYYEVMEYPEKSINYYNWTKKYLWFR